MTTITIDRATVEQALEALELLLKRVKTGYDGMPQGYGVRAADKAVDALRAALAQQAEPVEPHRWEGDHNIESPFNACMHKHYCMTLKQAEPAEPVAWEGWWLHHGQHNYRAKPLSPERVKELMKLAFEVGREATLPQQAEPVASLNAWAADRLARHGIPMPETPRCTDCRGIGYDASGQLCACQQNPSF